MSKRQAELRSAWFDVRTGLGSQDKFYRKMAKRGYTRAEVKNFLASVETAERFKRQGKVNYYPIMTRERQSLQADLIFYPRVKKHNGGFWIALTAINITTRFGYCFACKSKDAKTMVELFGKLEKKARLPITTLTTDNGKEFLNSGVQAWLRNRNIRHYTSEPGTHETLGMIERFNRTVKGLIAKYREAYHTKNWVNVIDKLMYNYNRSHHSSIGCSPYRADRSPTVRRDIVGKALERTAEVATKQSFQVGDRVRIKQEKGIFEKESTTWSKETYVITASSATGTSFTLEGLSRRYRHHELLKAKGVATKNPYLKRRRKFDIERHLDKVRGTAKAVDASAETPELRKRQVPLEKKQKKTKRPQVSPLGVGVFGYVKNPKYDIRLKKQWKGKVSRSDPLFWVCQVVEVFAKDRKVKLQYWEEGKRKNQYRKKSWDADWIESYGQVRRLSSQPKVSRGVAKLSEQDYAKLHPVL